MELDIKRKRRRVGIRKSISPERKKEEGGEESYRAPWGQMRQTEGATQAEGLAKSNRGEAKEKSGIGVVLS